MRSPVAQKILDDLKKKPWWHRLRIKLRVELLVLSCMGIRKYLTKRK